MPTSTRDRRARSAGSRLLAAPLAAALILTACTAQTPDQEPDGEQTHEPPAASDAPVQDVWVYERVRTAGADGALVDVTDQLTAGLPSDDDEAVELRPGVTFTPVPDLNPQLRNDTDGTRGDVDVVAGIIETDAGQALQVIATPTGPVPVGEDDLILLDLEHLGLDPGAPLIVDFAFAQGLPSDDDPDLPGAELLRARMADDRFQWYAQESEGELGPGFQTVFGSIPGGPATTSSANAPDEGVVTDALYRGPTARVVPAEGGGIGGGGIPAKGQPVIDPVDDLAECDDGPLKCVSEYFKGQKKGFEESLDKLFGDNMPSPPKDPPPPGCTGICGGGSGEPHFQTFDGERYDLQLVGEFTMADSELLTVQTRLAPYSGSDSVSVITAAAIELDGHRLTVRVDRDEPVWLDGEPVPLAEATQGTDLGQADALVYGNSLFVEGPAGLSVTVRHLRGRYLDVYVGAGTGATTWRGLLGDANGSAEDDLTARDGTRVGPDPETADLYEVFGDSWRITDEESLFDYGDGEDTAHFTDRSFPRDPLTVDDLTAEQRATAEAVCEAAGIRRATQLEWCIFDYAITGDIAFVRSSRHVSAVLDPAADQWATVVPGATRLGGDAALGDDVVLVPSRTEDAGQVSALDLGTGEVSWQVPTAGDRCVAVLAQGDVVAPVAAEDEDGTIALAVLDPGDGSRGEVAPTGLAECDVMTVVENTVVMRDGHTLVGVDAPGAEVRFELDLPEIVAGPVRSDDGMVWIVRAVDDEVHAQRVDPRDGTSTSIPLPVPDAAGGLAATSDGVVLDYHGEERGTGGLLRISDSGVVWQTPTPAEFDGEEYDRGPSGPLAVGAGHVTTYLGSSRVGVFDLGSGDPLRLIEPTSFANNGYVHAIRGDLVVVGPFGGEAWVEAYDLNSGSQAWDAPEPGIETTNDVKRIGPFTADGQVLVAASMAGGIVVSLVGPGE